ncbi:hypothetical protein T492DRAFT_484985 [Pavlovales sp. CCMP2436]|nr:hypothetical protein T492DRAFT_484985 [Pavlovales sp. CCMP2436]
MRRLQQCVNNGVSNLVKFTEAGGTVIIRARRANELQAQPNSTPNPPLAFTAAVWDTASAAAAVAETETETAAVPRASVVLEVVDSGVGLTAKELYLLNNGDAFSQAPGTAPRSGSSSRRPRLQRVHLLRWACQGAVQQTERKAQTKLNASRSRVSASRLASACSTWRMMPYCAARLSFAC